MAIKNYTSPTIEVIEIEIEDALLAGSEFSFTTDPATDSAMDMGNGGGF